MQRFYTRFLLLLCACGRPCRLCGRSIQGGNEITVTGRGFPEDLTALRIFVRARVAVHRYGRWDEVDVEADCEDLQRVAANQVTCTAGVLEGCNELGQEHCRSTTVGEVVAEQNHVTESALARAVTIQVSRCRKHVKFGG